MTASELRLFIGNPLSSLYTVVERMATTLITSNPRGLLRETQEAIDAITLLSEKSTLPSFSHIYQQVISEQATALKNTDLQFISGTIAAYGDLQLLRQYIAGLFRQALPSFLAAEHIYLTEFLHGRSHKKTKRKYLDALHKRLAQAQDWLPTNATDNQSLLQELAFLQRYIAVELQKLAPPAS